MIVSIVDKGIKKSINLMHFTKLVTCYSNFKVEKEPSVPVTERVQPDLN